MFIFHLHQLLLFAGMLHAQIKMKFLGSMKSVDVDIMMQFCTQIMLAIWISQNLYLFSLLHRNLFSAMVYETNDNGESDKLKKIVLK
jgi:hypothetical protein